MDKKPISEYDYDGRPVVILTGEDYEHPTIGYCFSGEWMYMVNGHDCIMFDYGFSGIQRAVAPTPSHFWDLPQ